MSLSRSSRELALLSRQLARPCRRTALSSPRIVGSASSHPHPWRRTVATFTAAHQAGAISTIKSDVDTASDEFKENERAMGEAMTRLAELTRTVQKGGPAKAREKHLARKKMLPRDRVTALIDPGTTFLELSPLAGHELYPEADVPSGGIITGIGVVEGVTCVIVANDSTVKGGTYYPITVKKHLRAQAVAQENNLPYVPRWSPRWLGLTCEFTAASTLSILVVPTCHISQMYFPTEIILAGYSTTRRACLQPAFHRYQW